MAFSFRKFLKGINLIPNASTQVSAKGDVEVLDSSGKLNYHNGTTASPVVTEGHTSTLSNKTFSDAVTLAEIATPSTPSSGNGKIYFKSDGFLYQIDDAGSEIRVGSGVNTIGTIDSQTKSANGAVITSGVNLILQNADVTFPGLVSETTQTFGGNKTFDGRIRIQDGSNTAPAIAFASDGNTGFYNIANDILGIATGGTERVRVGSNGSVTFNSASIYDAANTRLGIGTTSPSGVGHFKSGGATSVYLERGTTSNESGVRFYTTTTLDWTIGSGVDSVGSNLAFASGSGQTVRAHITSGGKFIVGGITQQANRHEMYVSSTTDEILYLENKSTSTSSDVRPGLAIIKGSTTQTAATNIFIQFAVNANGTQSGTLATNGSNAVALFNASDARLKKDIVPMDSVLPKIMQLNPVNFKWKSDNSESRGFIAQELEQVFPQFVGKTDNGVEELSQDQRPWSVTETGFVPYLVKAIQELKQEIESLKAQIGSN